MIDTYRLDDTRQTLILASRGGRLPEVIYWGPPVASGLEAEIARASLRDVTGGMLDQHPDLSICPEESQSFPGQPGLMARSLGGAPLRPAFRLIEARCDGTRLEIAARDEALGLSYSAELALDPDTGMLTARAALGADAPILVDWLAAPVLPASDACAEMIDFAGRWCGEMRPVTTPWSAGIRLRESRTGRTGHEHLPLLYLPERGTTNTGGTATALHYGWSGGHRMVAEELPDGRRQVQFGNAMGSETAPGTRFETATLYACRSETGLNGCAATFQRHLRDRIITWPKPDAPRPVHYNCWEAIYFDHSLPALKEIATRAAALGAERFVLDDGWFGTRDDDRQALGDWVVDARKYPDGLGPLIDHVHAEGMSFGIWFEPEMVNPESDTFRAHPDWALGPAEQTLGRQQMVLDLSNPEVTDYLYDRIAAVLSAHEIDYIKWDHNRVLPAPDAAQTRGIYALLARLRADFPQVEIESCASGGGRIDFGILEQCQRVWLSDSNDALERIRIQHDAALLLPLVVTGSHVGPRTCHSSGRVLPMITRAWTAAQRHIGFEMDPRELTEDEAATLTEVTAWWKANRDWRARADILRLDSADPSVTAEEQLAEDGSRFVVFAARTATSDQISPRPLRLTGLDPDARYRIRRLDTTDTPPGLSRGEVALAQGPLELDGAYLMAQGVTLPWSFPDRLHVLEGERL
ncbi:alpha-galactosidase [Litorisediminicola beolgyonensis]|uniref:alpha-galactosidase n=1 Tax=Litorisediminicola beolgyonensis TaxID=1173614 RepID=A0ABW3ZGR4_9RHOB